MNILKSQSANKGKNISCYSLEELIRLEADRVGQSFEDIVGSAFVVIVAGMSLEQMRWHLMKKVMHQ